MLTLIFDLDNTLYPVPSTRDQLFPPLFKLLEKPEYGLDEQCRKKAEQEIMRRPFQKVAEEFRFPKPLVDEALDLLRNLTFTGDIKPFADYDLVRKIPALRFLVTTGFYKLQKSKIELMQIEADFKEVCIIDPDKSSKTKKDAFEELIRKYDLDRKEIVVVGDDAESEIRAARELGLKSFLLDPHGAYSDEIADHRARRLINLLDFLEMEGLLEVNRSENLEGN